MSNRKLQTEIDRCLKKVAEGIDDFNDIFDKIYSTQHANQKDKLESDLKKEIKKLQRLRDQIKTWLGSNEIKDKKQLLENRKAIENQMERFKACEKEMKLKQFSKEGLMQQDRLDPAQVKKMELCEWITTQVDALGTQVDTLEAESETLGAQKRLDAHGKQRRSKIDHTVSQHKYHQKQLEIVLRMLENDDLTPEAVEENIKEDIEYYIEANQEPDFEENEFMYDELNLAEDVMAVNGLEASGKDAKQKDEPEKETPKEEKQDALPAAQEESTKITLPSKSEENKARKEAEDATKKVEKAALPKAKVAAPVKPTPSLTNAKISSFNSQNPAKTPSTSSVAPPARWAMPTSNGQEETKTLAAVLAAEKSRKDSEAQLASPSPTSAVRPPPGMVNKTTGQISPVKVSTAPSGNASSPAISPPPGMTSMATPTSTTAPSATSKGPIRSTVQSTDQKHSSSYILQGMTDLMAIWRESELKCYGKGDEIRRNAQLNAMLDQSLLRRPQHYDSQPTLYPTPRQPTKTPDYYPSSLSPAFESPTFFENLDLDTLFYIFYYQQDTKQQLLAARELKKQSWRFHKKYLTWFQRHEEPKSITDEYEQGTYIYFDYEGAWCQRKKTEFTFEYRYLESEDL